jgi:alpha-ribazole phosphatase
MFDKSPMNIPERVILIRHGETEWNYQGKFLGQSDPGLNELGVLQAQAMAQLLAQEKIDHIFSSDLLRARETAQIIAKLHNKDIKTMPSLREIDFGDWEGLSFVEIQKIYPVLLNQWIEDPLAIRIPNGETAQELYARVLTAWDLICVGVTSPQTIAIVAHGGPLRFLLCKLTEVDLSKQGTFTIGHGEKIILNKKDAKYIIKEK